MGKYLILQIKKVEVEKLEEFKADEFINERNQGRKERLSIILSLLDRESYTIFAAR